jgi:D-methionine transport system substrate-binding protein
MRKLSLMIILLALFACHKPNPNQLKIGAIAGPETELIETAKEVAQKKYDLDIQIVEFNDYNLPNVALQDGSIDANVYQHLPYLKAAIQNHGYTLQALGKTFVYPMGIYSKKINDLTELGENQLVAIPNDPSNEIRALLLLEKAKLIRLKTNPQGNLQDLIENPKHLQFKEMDAAQLPRALPDVELAVINTTFALPAGLNPQKDALFLEDKSSPYANLIVINKNTSKRKQLELFVKALQSKEVEEKAKSLFGDAAIPAW